MENTPKIKTKSNAYVFIDASNVWSVMKSVGKFIDYRKLKNYFKDNFGVKEVSIFYYDAFPKEGTRGYDTSLKHGFYTQLKKGFGFTVRKKKLKLVHITNDDGKKRS